MGPGFQDCNYSLTLVLPSPKVVYLTVGLGRGVCLCSLTTHLLTLIFLLLSCAVTSISRQDSTRSLQEGKRNRRIRIRDLDEGFEREHLSIIYHWLLYDDDFIWFYHSLFTVRYWPADYFTRPYYTLPSDRSPNSCDSLHSLHFVPLFFINNKNTTLTSSQFNSIGIGLISEYFTIRNPISQPLG